MDLSLKERHKLLGKFGTTFLIIYYIILFIFTVGTYEPMVQYSVANVLSLVFFILYIFNICTLWKLNKFSFWSTFISIAMIIYSNVRWTNLNIKLFKENMHYFTNFDIIYLILFSGLRIAFLLMFLIFIIKKREAFGIKFEFNKRIDTDVNESTDDCTGTDVDTE